MTDTPTCPEAARLRPTATDTSGLVHTPPARAALVEGIRGVGMEAVLDAEAVGVEDVVEDAALCEGAVLEVEVEGVV